MVPRWLRVLLIAAAPGIGTPAPAVAEAPLIIAHRGASGYLPEHTLAAKALAHGMGADYIEQDVVLTADDVPIVLHDIHLDDTTDVAAVFPRRARADGHFYAVDFSLAELRQLRAGERRGADGKAVFPGRFPAAPRLARVPTLEEEIALIAGLDKSRGTRTGLYLELKADAFHRREGKDLPAAVLAVLTATGYGDAGSPVYLQSFEPDTLRRIAGELASPLPLIQLIGENAWAEDGIDYEAMRSDEGLAAVASYAAGIGPWLGQLYLGEGSDGEARVSDLAARARRAGLLVHPYTFRSDQLPPGIDDFDALLELFINRLRVDGLFTDFPDRVRAFLEGGT